MANEQNTQGQSIRELVGALNRHLPTIGYQPSTIARFNADWNKLIAYADAKGADGFSVELGRSFVWERYGFTLGDKRASHNVNRAVHMLADFERYGMIFKQSSLTLKGFSEAYKPLFEDFLEHLRKTGTAEGSIRTWRSRLFRLEYFLQNNGVEKFEQIESHHMFAYVESLAGFASGTIGAAIRILRRLFDYAIAHGEHHTNFINLLPDIRRIKKYRLPTVFAPEEVERILTATDRNNPIGKRNYAILLLVARLGLRISDVRGLRFDDINWQTKTISIIQKKTGTLVDLPLFEDIGWAIIDYLRNGRPQTVCQCIFVRHNAPYDELGNSLRALVLRCMQKAGIERPANKPIGMHTFRHSIATAMLKNGAKYTEVAQVLGHLVPESAEDYISLDEEQLRQCALEVTL
jgi:site-specific recombinase XerD